MAKVQIRSFPLDELLLDLDPVGIRKVWLPHMVKNMEANSRIILYFVGQAVERALRLENTCYRTNVTVGFYMINLSLNRIQTTHFP